MSDQSAIRLLQAAIAQVQENCTGPEYKNLMASLRAADQEAEKALQSDDAPPKTLKDASVKARQSFADARQSTSDSK